MTNIIITTASIILTIAVSAGTMVTVEQSQTTVDGQPVEQINVFITTAPNPFPTPVPTATPSPTPSISPSPSPNPSSTPNYNYNSVPQPSMNDFSSNIPQPGNMLVTVDNS